MTWEGRVFDEPSTRLTPWPVELPLPAVAPHRSRYASAAAAAAAAAAVELLDVPSEHARGEPQKHPRKEICWEQILWYYNTVLAASVRW